MKAWAASVEEVFREAAARWTLIAYFTLSSLFILVFALAVNLDVVNGALAGAKLFGQSVVLVARIGDVVLRQNEFVLGPRDPRQNGRRIVTAVAVTKRPQKLADHSDLIGGVVHRKFDGYRLPDQWTSYGWNLLPLPDGHDYQAILGVLQTMEEWDPADRRPMIVFGQTTKGYWPAAVDGRIPGGPDQIVGYPSHPFGFKMNSQYIVSLARTFEERYGVQFDGIRDGEVTDPRKRLVQFKTNVDIVMSVLDRNGLGDWLANRLVEIGDSVTDRFPLRIDVTKDPFLDDRLAVAHLPDSPQKVTIKHPATCVDKDVSIALFRKPGEKAGARRAISEIVKWLNYVTEGRMFTISADLSESINLEHGSLWGHYDPQENPCGTRLKAAIQEAGNASTAIGLVSQNASVDPDKFAGVWAISGTYGAFTPLMYLPARVWSQQNQDSRFRTGVLHILAAHSGPETAADARTHFGIFAPQVWKLFPRGHVINLSFWDYNDVAPGYFAAAAIAAREKNVGIITIEVAYIDHTKSGSRNHVIPGARILCTVTMKFRPVMIDENPAKKMPMMTRLTWVFE